MNPWCESRPAVSTETFVWQIRHLLSLHSLRILPISCLISFPLPGKSMASKDSVMLEEVPFCLVGFLSRQT